MKSFASKLAKFVNPAPADVDPEDERVQSSSESESENEEARAHYVEVGKSALRQDEPNVDKKKYSSARTSRKNIEESESESEEESSGKEFLDMSAEENGEDDDDESEHSEEDSQSQEQEASESEEETLFKPKTGTQSTVSALLQQEQKEILSRLSKNSNEDATKGKAVSAQMKIYEGLLDARISIQKAVVASHSEDIEDPEETMDAVCDLIAEIQTLRNRLEGSSKVCKKRSFEELAEDTFEMDRQLSKRRENILSKWSRKVQLSSGNTAMQGGSNFKSLNQSASRQVESVLGDMDRLLKRTQVNRSQYKVNGEVPDHSDEIFDDTDFYRLLLTELVERRMAEKNANGDNLKWTVAKASKNKMKKARDTSASKGRRLRYDVQDKIVSFDAPRPGVYTWSDQQADDLFASLLGVTITMDDDEPEVAQEEEDVNVEEFNLFG